MIINQKEVKFRFGMLSVELFLQKATKFAGSTYSAYGLSVILHSGAVNFYEVKEQPLPVTFEEIYDHVEQVLLTGNGKEELMAVLNEFEQCQPLKKVNEQLSGEPAQPEQEEELKKKTVTDESLTEQA